MFRGHPGGSQKICPQRRRELNMVFQFEHMDVDADGSKQMDGPPLRSAGSESHPHQMAERTGYGGLEQPVLGKPRPAPVCLPVWRRRPLPGGFRENAGHLPPLYAGHALYLPGGRTGHDQRAFPGHLRLPGPGQYQCLPRTHRPGRLYQRGNARHLRKKSRDNARTPFQWSDDANAGFTTGNPWIMVNPNYREINAREQLAPGRLCLPLLSEANPPAQKPSRHGLRKL